MKRLAQNDCANQLRRAGRRTTLLGRPGRPRRLLLAHTTGSQRRVRHPQPPTPRTTLRPRTATAGTRTTLRPRLLPTFAAGVGNPGVDHSGIGHLRHPRHHQPTHHSNHHQDGRAHHRPPAAPNSLLTKQWDQNSRTVKIHAAHTVRWLLTSTQPQCGFGRRVGNRSACCDTCYGEALVVLVVGVVIVTESVQGESPTALRAWTLTVNSLPTYRRT